MYFPYKTKTSPYTLTDAEEVFVDDFEHDYITHVIVDVYFTVDDINKIIAEGLLLEGFNILFNYLNVLEYIEEDLETILGVTISRDKLLSRVEYIANTLYKSLLMLNTRNHNGMFIVTRWYPTKMVIACLEEIPPN